MIRLLLLCAAIVLFLAAAVVDFHWLGATGSHALGLLALASVAFAASFLPDPRRL